MSKTQLIKDLEELKIDLETKSKAREKSQEHNSAVCYWYAHHMLSDILSKHKDIDQELSKLRDEIRGRSNSLESPSSSSL